MNLQQAYREILADERLPSPNGIALELLRLTREPETDGAALARVVAMDPAICARIMRVVNAPTFGVRRQVAAIDQAVTLLGFRAVAGIAVAYSVLQQHRAGLREFPYDAFWLAAVGKAVVVRVLTRHGRRFPAGEAFTYALLSNIGRLALVSVYPDRYREVLLTLGRVDAIELAAAERAVFEIDAETLSAFMMREWGMPDYHAALTDEADPAAAVAPRARALLRTCRIGDLLARILVDPAVGRHQLAHVVGELAAIDIDAEQMAWLWKEIVEQFHDAAASLEIPACAVPSLAEIYAHAGSA